MKTIAIASHTGVTRIEIDDGVRFCDLFQIIDDSDEARMKVFGSLSKRSADYTWAGKEEPEELSWLPLYNWLFTLNVPDGFCFKAS